MFHTQNMMPGLKPDVVLSLQLSAMGGEQNVITIQSNGLVTCQPNFRGAVTATTLNKGRATVEEYMKSILPVDAFLDLERNYYEILSDRTCGTAANLYLKVGSKENWVGIWNFSLEKIPVHVDAGMYEAAFKLAKQLANDASE